MHSKQLGGVCCWSVFLLLTAACGPSGGGGDTGGTGGSDGGGGGAADSGPSGPDAAACQSASVSADEVLRPVDIIWVVDTSGSMNDEASEVQDALNDFSSFIANSGIDYRVILIADANDMNVPAPLGGSPEFLHVNRTIGSSDALQLVNSTYNMYSSFLRPGASTHFVIVTDDESNWSHGNFDTQIAAHGNASFSDYTLHAICSEETVIFTPPPPLPAVMGPCSGGLGTGGAADPGLTYIDMAASTGGLWSSICTANWQPIFDEVAVAVSEAIALPCTYDIPDPGAGDILDPEKVNFIYQSSTGGDQTLGRVDGAGSCSAGGWYYDDPTSPTQILLCPDTCDTLEADPEGEVEIQFGCATVVN